MDKKRRAESWLLALIHTIKSVFLMPLLIIGIFLFYPVLIINGLIGGNDVSFAVEISIIMILAIWVGVIWSAKGMARKYIISESDKIINISIIIAIVIFAIDRISKFFYPGGFSAMNLVFTVASILMLITFYLASKKYIKNTK